MEERGNGLLPLRSWLALWAALAAADPRRCLEHMLLLGYAGDPAALLAASRPRRIERGLATGPARSVFQVPPTSGRKHPITSRLKAKRLCALSRHRVF